ncbi:hypothetical protein C1H46_023258 [Malus baccata]|uniref:DOMON domain-containing protein n=1 Tax=Malus baccata TaxID=106549 RepID=A0A540LXT5_MALBA|nr:hypothetical protein C1H46_023258 [Malus baccata]
MKRVAGAPLVFIWFCGLTPPCTKVNQGGSWLGFVEGSGSFKRMAVVSKNSTEVGWNRRRKMGGRENRTPAAMTSFWLFSDAVHNDNNAFATYSVTWSRDLYIAFTSNGTINQCVANTAQPLRTMHSSSIVASARFESHFSKFAKTLLVFQTN